MYKIKILSNRCLTTHFFCKHTLKSIGTALETFGEKSIKKGIIDRFFFLLHSSQLSSIGTMHQSVTKSVLWADMSDYNARDSFVLLNTPQILAHNWMVENL